MSAAEHVLETRRWQKYAEDDLAAAHVMLSQPSIAPRHACWLAQQSAEKAIKAALIYLQTEFPRRHDLDALRNLIPAGWHIKSAPIDLAELSEWAVEARYPGDWPEATHQDAQRAVEQASQVILCVREDIDKRV